MKFVKLATIIAAAAIPWAVLLIYTPMHDIHKFGALAVLASWCITSAMLRIGLKWQ